MNAIWLIKLNANISKRFEFPRAIAWTINRLKNTYVCVCVCVNILVMRKKGNNIKLNHTWNCERVFLGLFFQAHKHLQHARCPYFKCSFYIQLISLIMKNLLLNVQIVIALFFPPFFVFWCARFSISFSFSCTFTSLFWFHWRFYAVD